MSQKGRIGDTHTPFPVSITPERPLDTRLFIAVARNDDRDVRRTIRGEGRLSHLARTNLSGELNYTDRNIVEKLFQTYTMRIERFHETWNGSQTSAERWLIAYTSYWRRSRRAR